MMKRDLSQSMLELPQNSTPLLPTPYHNLLHVIVLIITMLLHAKDYRHPLPTSKKSFIPLSSMTNPVLSKQPQKDCCSIMVFS